MYHQTCNFTINGIRTSNLLVCMIYFVNFNFAKMISLTKIFYYTILYFMMLIKAFLKHIISEVLFIYITRNIIPSILKCLYSRENMIYFFLFQFTGMLLKYITLESSKLIFSQMMLANTVLKFVIAKMSATIY